MSESSVIHKRRGISAVWLLPILALSICGWLLYTSYQSRGVEITIYFDDATGIIPGKTRVMAKGIPVGLVKKLQPDLNNQRVKVVIKMEQSVVQYLVEDTVFWIVRPELSASSIEGLDTILSGSYIGAQAGSSAVPRREFNGLPSAPPVAPDTPGLHIQLRAEQLDSIQTGTSIYYRNIKIGKVEKYELEGDKNILIDLFIEPEYAHLVRTESRFCNVSGLQIGGKLPNVKIRLESLASLLRGGILLHTPEQFQNSPPAKNNHIFKLYPDFESANYGIPMTLKLASGENIVEGTTKIMYRGLEAGFVKEIRFNEDQQRSVTAHILIDPRAELILRENTKFWIVKPKISPTGIENLRLLISGPYITFQPGDGAFKNSFEIQLEPPPQKPLRPGKTFVLTSDEPVSLSSSSPIYYKNINVGEIIAVDLDASGETIKTTIFIYSHYLHLLSPKSIFWLQDGVAIQADFSGIAVSAGPLTRILYGGISFTTPDGIDQKKHITPPEEKEFPLYSSYKKAVDSVSELQPPGKQFFILAKNAESMSKGAPLLHKNVKIGYVRDFQFTDDQQGVLIDCFVHESFKGLINTTTRFYNTSGVRVSGGIEGINLQAGSLQSIISGGIGCINVPGKTNTSLPPDAPYPLYDNLDDALHADEITLIVYLEQTKGLKEGSPVKYKGITTGRVTKLSFAENLKIVTAEVRVNKNVAPLFRAQTRLWVAEAEINLSRVKNLDTIIFGSFLTFLPGDGPQKRTFMALNSPPHTEIANQSGLGVILETSHLGSLTVGSPVYYRQVQVGRVTGSQLSPSFTKVYVFATISSPYIAIVRDNTRFWNVSGARFQGGLFSGITVSTESFEAIMKGGIALATPGNEKIGPKAKPGQHFILHDKPEKLWLDWNPDIVLLEKESQKGAALNEQK